MHVCMNVCVSLVAHAFMFLFPSERNYTNSPYPRCSGTSSDQMCAQELDVVHTLNCLSIREGACSVFLNLLLDGLC